MATLSPNFGYDELAAYEEAQRKSLLGALQQRLLGLKTGITGQYDSALNSYKTTAATRRSALAKSLTDTAQENFNLANPAILEDLNNRGVFSSGTAVANAQAQKLKELSVANQDVLNEFDSGSNQYEDSLNSQKLSDLNSIDSASASGLSQIDQDTVDQLQSLRQSQLSNSLQQQNTAQEQALAERLAKQQGRNSLNSSLIGVGGTLLGASLLKGGMGNLFGGTAASTAPYAGGAVGPLAPAAPGGFGALGTIGALGAGGIGAMLLSRAVQNKVGSQFGTTLGNVAGTIANPIGAQLNKAKSIISNPAKAISNVFCFDPQTKIMMDDGGECLISQLWIGAETKGGKVKSIRTSEAEDGDRYLWKGIKITGKHAIKEEGKWVRVEDSPYSDVLKGSGIVWSIVTEKHRVWVNNIEMADELETDNYENLTLNQSLEELNKAVI